MAAEQHNTLNPPSEQTSVATVRAMRAAFQRVLTAPSEAEAAQAWAEAHHLKAVGLAQEAAMRATTREEASP